MVLPIVAAGAGIAARAVAKKIVSNAAKKAAKTTVKKGTKSTKGQGMSTGKAKITASQKSSTKKYEAPIKGSGKPKYQNVIKEDRLNTKKRSVESTTKVKQKILGKAVTQQEKRSLGNRVENVPKIIDREYKVQKGVRTEKSNVKVPIKKRGN